MIQGKIQKEIVIRNHTIHVSFEDRIVRIISDRELWTFLSEDIHNNATALSQLIRQDYLQLSGSELEISVDSLAVEILGHVYAEHFSTIIENHMRQVKIDFELDKIIRHCAVIDCGEAEEDGNRWFWNMLAPFRNIISEILFKAGGSRQRAADIT